MATAMRRSAQALVLAVAPAATQADRSGPRVLFLTPAQAVIERLEALQGGIDQSLALPMGDVELAGRIRWLLKRARPQSAKRLLVAMASSSNSTEGSCCGTGSGSTCGPRRRACWS